MWLHLRMRLRRWLRLLRCVPGWVRRRALAQSSGLECRRWRNGRWSSIASVWRALRLKKGEIQMRSMTGFGRAQLESGGFQVLAQARALNQRFFEFELNLPRGGREYHVQTRTLSHHAVEPGRAEP